MSTLSQLVNIGQKLEQQLREIGVDTPEKLKLQGSKACWLEIKHLDASACYNRLCALEGAIQGVRWHKLPDEVKQELKEFYILAREQ